MNNNDTMHQILISGVGGQGVLFVTRLLAEAAIGKGLPVFTSETHGMAQRGGTVVSHLKVGHFASPLIMPGDADGLIGLKHESIDLHGGYLKSGAWAAVNSSQKIDQPVSFNLHCCDADQLARVVKNPRASNLVMLGFLMARASEKSDRSPGLFCSLEDVTGALEKRLSGRASMLQASLKALMAGAGIK